MSEKAKKPLDDSTGMAFTDKNLPPDPKGEVTEELDNAAVERTVRDILNYTKERADEGYIVYRKEMEMITQDTNENIDEAISRLKEAGEIYESEKDAFRVRAKSTGGNGQKKNVHGGSNKGLQGKRKTIKKEEKMSGKLNEFENRKVEEGKAREGDTKDDVYDLTETDMPTQMFDGERATIDDMLDKTIIIRDMATRPSSFSEGDYVILQVEEGGNPYVIITGSAVLVRQIGEKSDKLPFRCKIVEQQSMRSKYKYYTLSPIITA